MIFMSMMFMKEGMKMNIILGVILGLLALFGFNWFMGYKKGNIQLDLNERYISLKEYVQAVQVELKKQGRQVSYQGNRIFIIDNHRYLLIERNVSMGGVPLQHTVLKRLKKGQFEPQIK